MSRSSEPIERVSVIEEIARRLRAEILANAYEVGEKLPTEMQLRDRFGVGRSSVREALRVLQTEGYVELRPGTGAFVRSVEDHSDERIRMWFIEKETELDEMMEVRVAVEPLAVKLAIEKASDAEVNRIAETQARFADAVRTGDPVQLARLDEELHSTIIAASQNSLLIKINQLLLAAFAEYRLKAFSIPENIENALGPHNAIVAAIRARDVEKAQQAMHDHLAISLNDIDRMANDG